MVAGTGLPEKSPALLVQLQVLVGPAPVLVAPPLLAPPLLLLPLLVVPPLLEPPRPR